MSKSLDKDVEKYVLELMPKSVKKALGAAKYDLYYGPSGGGGMGYVKASKIVNDWWNENMREDLMVDDGGNVATESDFDAFLKGLHSDRYKEALLEAVREMKMKRGSDDAEEYAVREANSYVEGTVETTTKYDSRDVKRLVLGRDWP